MIKHLYQKFDKKMINTLPRVLFDGKIVVIQTPEETQPAVDYLLSHDILGFDTETRPSFVRGVMHRVALLQVSTRMTCFLFRLKRTGLTPALKYLLEDTTVTKVAISWNDDLRSLHRIGKFNEGNFIDVQKLVPEMGIEDISLQKLYANIFRQKISKAEQLSNWERETLTNKQLNYAATDAWACIMLYDEIMRLKQTGEYDIIPVVEETENEISEENEPV